MKTTKPEVRPRSGKKPIPIETRPPLPDWVADTPKEPRPLEYSLEVTDWDETNVAHEQIPQKIELTRAEYILLKQSLAIHRGWDVPAEMAPKPADAA